MKPVKESQKPVAAPETKKADDKSKERQEQKKEDIKKETQSDVKPTEDKKVKGSDSTVSDKDKVKEKKPEVKTVRKHEVSVYGRSLPISLKYSTAIGKFIRGKRIDNAIRDLELVKIKKKVVPMTGELAHKKGKGISSGKYPVKASENFIKLLKSLSANGANHGMELDNTRIAMTIPNKAPEQIHRGGRAKFKRTHVKIIAKENGNARPSVVKRKEVGK
jgi:large subunit ribosomal protein L22